MKRYVSIILTCLILMLSGCSGLEKSKQINPDEKSQNEEFTQTIDEVVTVGEHKILIKKVLFDISALTLEYEVLEELPSLNILVSPESKQRPTDRVSDFGEVSVDFPYDVGEVIASIPHNLELVNQRVKILVHIGSESVELFIDFPGEKLARVTKVQYFDDKGEPVSDLKKAVTRVTVGVNYTEVESGDLGKDILVLDLRERRILEQTMSSYTGSGDVIANFEPISMLRGKIKLKLIPENKLITIGY